MIKDDSKSIFINGKEYNESPPLYLIKAMEKHWAIELINNGVIRLGSLEYYRKFDDQEIGDQNDGKGLYKLNGHEMNSGTINKTYIWCSSKPRKNGNNFRKLLPEYNTIIRVHNIDEFVNRILLVSKEKGFSFFLHLGCVKYDRSKEIDKKTLNNQLWNHNLFQKDKKYKHQNEYRFAFIENTLRKDLNEYIDLQLGNCSDIITIER